MTIIFELKDRNGNNIELNDTIKIYDFGRIPAYLGIAEIYFDEADGRLSLNWLEIAKGVYAHDIESYDLINKAIPNSEKI